MKQYAHKSLRCDGEAVDKLEGTWKKWIGKLTMLAVAVGSLDPPRRQRAMIRSRLVALKLKHEETASAAQTNFPKNKIVFGPDVWTKVAVPPTKKNAPNP